MSFIHPSVLRRLSVHLYSCILTRVIVLCANKLSSCVSYLGNNTSGCVILSWDVILSWYMRYCMGMRFTTWVICHTTWECFILSGGLPYYQGICHTIWGVSYCQGMCYTTWVFHTIGDVSYWLRFGNLDLRFKVTVSHIKSISNIKSKFDHWLHMISWIAMEVRPTWRWS